MTPQPDPRAAGRPAADTNDQPYVWGRPPASYLSPRQLVRLTILRSRIEDRHLLRGRTPGESFDGR